MNTKEKRGAGGGMGFYDDFLGNAFRVCKNDTTAAHGNDAALEAGGFQKGGLGSMTIKYKYNSSINRYEFDEIIEGGGFGGGGASSIRIDPGELTGGVGGGGGYSGGGASIGKEGTMSAPTHYGGGGGSFNSGFNQQNLTAENGHYGDGKIEISILHTFYDISSTNWYFKENADISGNDASFNSVFVSKDISASHWYIREDGDISGNDASFNSVFASKDISASHWYIREDGDISGNDASFNSVFASKDISASHWYIREDGDISGNDASFNSVFVSKDISASHWYIREDGDISGNDANLNSLFLDKDISASHWYIKENGDISGNDASFNSLFLTQDVSASHWYIRDKLYVFTNHTFTNCTATGKDGPTLLQCTNEYSSTTWASNTDYFNMDETNSLGIQEWTVPKTGIYNIAVFGAGGGTKSNPPPNDYWGEGGKGAKVSGNVRLIKGSKLYISVGHEGNQDGNKTFGGGGKGNPGETSDGHFYGNGFSGGGGTFVSTSLIPFSNVGNNTGLLFVAGGGGGASGFSAQAGQGSNWNGDKNGGNAGYPNGSDGENAGILVDGVLRGRAGLGGTQTAGGTNGGGGDNDAFSAPGSDGSSGEWFKGGDAGQNVTVSFVQGGGGGSGYYGGGGGDNQGGGGGGGSSFINSFYVTDGIGGVRDDADAKGNGKVEITAQFSSTEPDILANDASFNSLFVNKDISASHWYIRENGDISGNDASFNKLVIADSIIPGTNNITLGTVDNPIKSLFVSDSSIFMVKDGVASHKISVQNNKITFKKLKRIAGISEPIEISDSSIFSEFFNENQDIIGKDLKIFKDISSSNVKIFSDMNCENAILKNITVSNNDASNILEISSTDTVMGINAPYNEQSYPQIRPFSMSSDGDKALLLLNPDSYGPRGLVIHDNGYIGINKLIQNPSDALVVEGDVSSNNLLTENLRIGEDVFDHTSSSMIIDGDISCNGSMQISNISLGKTLNDNVAVDVHGKLVCDIIEPLPDIEGGANSFAGIAEVGPLFLRGNYLIKNRGLDHTTNNERGNFGITGHNTENTVVAVNLTREEIGASSGPISQISNIEKKLYDFTSHQFTSCGKTGREGPNLTECRDSYGGTTNDWWNDTTNNYLNMDPTNSPGIQEWTVPYTGTFKILAKGADSDNDEGGRGAIEGGNFTLTEGDVIYILVGQSGSNGGGAGGTFVVRKSGNTPSDCTESDILIIAGGGGGIFGNAKGHIHNSQASYDKSNDTKKSSSSSVWNEDGLNSTASSVPSGQSSETFDYVPSNIVLTDTLYEYPITLRIRGTYEKAATVTMNYPSTFTRGNQYGDRGASFDDETYSAPKGLPITTVLSEWFLDGAYSYYITGLPSLTSYPGDSNPSIIGNTFNTGKATYSDTGYGVNNLYSVTENTPEEAKSFKSGGKGGMTSKTYYRQGPLIIPQPQTFESKGGFGGGGGVGAIAFGFGVKGPSFGGGGGGKTGGNGADMVNGNWMITGWQSVHGGTFGISTNWKWKYREWTTRDINARGSGGTSYNVSPSASKVSITAKGGGNDDYTNKLEEFTNPNKNGAVIISSIGNPPTLNSIDYSMFIKGNVFVNGTITQNTSDQRIKKNISDVNKSEALEIVKNIPNKYYNYISKNIGTECGFIAQDVKKYFPNAVTIRKNILIPSEYREINTNFTAVWFNKYKNTIEPNRIYNENGKEITKRKYKIIINDLSNNSMDSKYRFYLDKQLNGYVELKPIETPKTFLFDSKLDYLFVFGKYINDFNALDKNQIFSLHHAAIQEIENNEDKNNSEIELLKKENNKLKKEIEILKNLAIKANQRINNL